MQSSDKANLRHIMLSNRPKSSEGLFANLVRIAMECEAQVIASYSPQQTEPDVTEFNNWVIATGRELLLPRVKSDSLEFAAGETTVGAYGLQEPNGMAVDTDLIELVLVPALAVDSSGNRLGKGKGYYDRVLGLVHCPKFAVIFEDEFVEQLPVEPHDQKVSGVVSPTAINYFLGH
jgi:5-formyltetrahydrofolate cyclo-ligase